MTSRNMLMKYLYGERCNAFTIYCQNLQTHWVYLENTRFSVTLRIFGSAEQVSIQEEVGVSKMYPISNFVMIFDSLNPKKCTSQYKLRKYFERNIIFLVFFKFSKKNHQVSNDTFLQMTFSIVNSCYKQKAFKVPKHNSSFRDLLDKNKY